MKNTDWKSIAELIGIAAIVASLIFVGLELRQSHRIALGTQYQERTALAVEQQFRATENKTISNWTAEQIRGDSGFFNYGLQDSSHPLVSGKSPQELSDLARWANVTLLLMDNNHFQYQMGLLPEESWEMMRNRMTLYFNSNPFAKANCEDRADLFRESFVEMCQSLIGKE